jgi:ribose-phosphate pyrophosphokinase
VSLGLVCGAQGGPLAEAISRALDEPLCRAYVETFPDGETHLVVPEDLGERDLFLVHSLNAPAGERLVELCLLADACRRAGARSLTAVLPYVAYARQDRASRMGEAVGGPVMARLVASAGFHEVIAVDLHSEAAEGWFGESLRHLSALPALAEAARPFVPPGSVVVSPDLGGAKRAEKVARLLELPLALVHKSRRSAQEVFVHRVLGDVRERACLVVDDLISTGGTLQAAIAALRERGCAPSVVVLATHALLVDGARARLQGAGIERLVHSDSVPGSGAPLPFGHQVVSLAPLLASAIRAASARR